MNSTALNGIQLHDIVPAPSAGFWPPAPGWWILTFVILVILYFSSKRLVQFQRQRRFENQVLTELDTLRTEQPRMFALRISMLLRRVALMKYAREDVASLNGDAWLTFLDETGGNGEFQNGIGQNLATLPYSPEQSINENDIQALLALARNWLQLNCRQVSK